MPLGNGGSSHVLEARVESSGISSFQDEIAGAGSAVSGFKAAVAGAGAALGAVAAGGLAAAAGAAAQFEEQMIEVEKVTNPQTAREMGDAIQEMASKMPVAQSELAAIAADAGRFGVEGPKAIRGFTEAVSKMAVATDLSADRAGEALAKLGQLTGTPIEQVENLGSSINELSNNFATSSSEIVDSMLRSSAALSQLGISQTDIAGLSAALNAVSESSERAGSRMRRLAQEMIDPAKVGDLASSFGKTEEQFKAMVKSDPTGSILQMARAMKQGGRQAELLRSTLGTTSRQALSALGQNLDGVNRALDMSAQSFKENTSLQKEFDAASSTFNSKLQVMKNRLRNVGISIGTQVLPYLSRLLEYVNSGIARFSAFNQRTDGMAGAVALAGTAIGGFTVALASLFSMLGGVSAVIGGIGTAFAALTAPIGIAAGAITGIGTTAAATSATLYATIYGALGAVGGAVTGLASALLGLPAAVATAAASLSATLAGAATAAYTALVGLPATVLAFATALQAQLVTAASSAAMALLTLPARAAAATAAFISSASVTGLFSAALGGLQTVAYLAAGGVQVLTASLVALAAPVAAIAIAVAALYAAWKTNFLGIRNITQGVVSFIKALLRGDFAAMQTIVQNAVSNIRGYWNQHLRPMAETAKRIFTQIKTAVTTALRFIWTNVIQPIVARIRKVWRQHGQELRQEAMETWTAIRGHIQTVINFVKPLIDWFTTTAGAAWAKWGDEIEAVARVVFDAILGIIEFTLDAIMTTLTVVMNLIQGDWEEAWNAIAGFLERTIRGIVSWLSSTGKDIVRSAVEAVIGAVKSVFEGLYNWLIGNSLIKDIFIDIADYIRNDAASDLASAATSAATGAANALKDAFNNALPDKLSIPSVTVGGGSIAGQQIPSATIGGQSLSIPQLDTGGLIEAGGLAQLHQGEMVVPAAEVDRSGGDGGGDTTININGDIYADSPRDAGRSIADELRSQNFNS